MSGHCLEACPGLPHCQQSLFSASTNGLVHGPGCAWPQFGHLRGGRGSVEGLGGGGARAVVLGGPRPPALLPKRWKAAMRSSTFVMLAIASLKSSGISSSTMWTGNFFRLRRTFAAWALTVSLKVA